MEAIEDHFGAPSPSSDDLLDAFNHHRAEIENTARTLPHVMDTKQLLLHSGHFRFSLSGRSDCV
jgi:hypothetical protein